MDHNDDRTRLVYIASIGRSGSTLVEVLLGAHSQIATVGELHLWPHEIRGHGRRLPCGCGLPMLECPFWDEMRRRVDPLAAPAPRIDAFREAHTGGRTLRPDRLRDFVPRSSDGGPGGVPDDIATYADNNDRAYRAFLDCTQERTGARPRWLVDSSKDPYRLLWLLRSGRFDLTVVHVVRDPRGFVNSERANEGVGGLDLLRLAARKSGAWVAVNRMVRRCGRMVPAGRYVLVPYERLATETRPVLAELCLTIGCSFEDDMVQGLSAAPFHAVGGNPMRHERREVRLDEAWRSALPPAAQRVTRLVTAGHRRSFGY